MNVVVVNMCLTYLPSFVVRLMKQFECTRTRRFGISVIVGIYCDMNPSGMTSCLKLQQLAEVRPNNHKMLLRIHCKLSLCKQRVHFRQGHRVVTMPRRDEPKAMPKPLPLVLLSKCYKRCMKGVKKLRNKMLSRSKS